MSTEEDLELMFRLEALAELAGLRTHPEVLRVPEDTLAAINAKAEEADVLKADGSRELSADWDIGEDNTILTERIDARDSEGIHIYSEDEGTYMFIFNNGIISREVDAIATYEMERNDTTPTAHEIGIWTFRAKNSLNSTYQRYAGIRAYADDVTHNSMDGSLDFETLVASANTVVMSLTGGKVGIRNISPDRRLDIFDASDPQLRLTQGEPTVYTDLQTDSNGYFLIAPSDYTVRLVRDGSNYVDMFVNSDGDLILDPSGGEIVAYDEATSFRLKIYSGATLKIDLNAGGTSAINTDLNLAGHLTLSGKNVITDTSIGLQLATAANQKLGFFGTTPVIQLAKASYNNWAALSDLLNALAAIGLIDSA